MPVLGDVPADSWPSFVATVQEVIREGLEQLALGTVEGGFDVARENDLNRELYFRMRRVAVNRKKALFAAVPRPPLEREHTWSLAPVSEANNQPSPDDPERTPREDKRPDLQWSFQDDQAEDPDRATRTYVVECKRLGEPVGSWKLNANYVVHGVRRFTDASHLYGKDDVGGGMVGYVQSMGVDAIWAEIIGHLAASDLPSLLAPNPLPGPVAMHATQHDLQRIGAGSPYRLHHLWVDLRHRPAARAA